ncbi:MIF4G domain protein [Gregarina niphandrodes]|uniref:MIF4G domain protein n=1 Tax=Gregarina niphandrodes TaxID=110365 RepID=A0A023B0G4_GRENI|nr:MIF4G domain protein [Gregarina niphandrodes]EZG44219.1 MIF4G domain protein [Gregarina niphandrodes]|eukprot:XP_011132752.1 MIF4G domain protein [Gregarina niphandrodes]
MFAKSSRGSGRGPRSYEYSGAGFARGGANKNLARGGSRRGWRGGARNPPPPPTHPVAEPPAAAPVPETRPPPPPADLVAAEAPRPFDASKAGVDPALVLAMAPRLGPLALETVLQNWTRQQIRNKAAEQKPPPATHSYPIATLLQLREPSISTHARRRSQPGISPSGTRQREALANKEWVRAPVPPPPVVAPQKRPELSRPVALRRHTKSLLNKLTVEKFEAIADRLVRDILESCADEEELSVVVDEVYKKAVSEPDFSEMYADLVLVLRARSPQFQKDDQDEPRKKPVDFQRCIVFRCQDEFDAITQYDPAAEEAALAQLSEEDAEAARMKRKRLILGSQPHPHPSAHQLPTWYQSPTTTSVDMRFIGELFMRKVILSPALKSVVCTLIVSNRARPEPHIIECMCELLTTIGYALETQCKETSKIILTTLSDLRESFDTRIDCKIQDLIDLADNGWRQRNVFKTKATTLNDVESHILESNVAGVESEYPYKDYVYRLDDEYRQKKSEAKRQKQQQSSSP